MVLHRTLLQVCSLFALVVGMFSAPALAKSPTGDSGMTISEGNLVSMEYTLTLEDEKVLDTNVGGEPLTFTQGQHQIIPGLETALTGMKAGESKHVTVQPKDGYGEVDARRIQEVPIEHIPTDARKVGMQLQGQGPQGRPVRSIVKEVKEEVVVLDFNHPLAGKTLFFDIKILDVKAAPTP